ncbi:MAG: serine hydrolase [Polyangiales bacterium]
MRLLAACVLLVGCGSSAPPPSCPPVPSVATVASAPAPSASASVEAPVPKTPEEALTRFLTAKQAAPSWFTPSFLAHVPIDKIEQIRKGMFAQLGAFASVAPGGDGFVSTFEKGKIPTRASIDDKGRFKMLWFGPPEPEAISVDESVKRLSALPGKKSLLVVTDGKDRNAVDADTPLAVGSTFKLAVLAALRTQIASKKRAFKDVVALDAKWKSLPSGMLQEWPDGSQLTLETLATLMISRSDNTATDALIAIAGRPAIEPLAPHAHPFLTTREAFVLKAKGNESLLAKWSKGDEAARRALLPEIDAAPLPKVSAVHETPTAIDEVEWKFSAHELCALVEKVHDLPLMSVNPGVAKAADWERVAYKGGSEPGVLNLTTRLTAKGHSHCVVFTINHEKAVEDEAVFALYGQLLAALH